MLKVTIHEGDNGIKLVLEGRLCGECAAEAERSWRNALAGADSREISIDLAGVSYVDRDGESLLMDMLEQGVAVLVGGVWMEHLVADLRRRVSLSDSAPSEERRGRIAAPAFRKTLALPQVQGFLRET
jgi:ABC-type transporter Mla MlaB component